MPVFVHSFFYSNGYQHFSSFIGRFGSLPTHNILTIVLPSNAFQWRRDFMATIHIFTKTFRWSIEASLSNMAPSFLSMTLRPLFYGLLKTPPLFTLPTEGSIICCINYQKQWCFPIKLWKLSRQHNRILCGRAKAPSTEMFSLKFRIQYNGLRLRFKYRFHTSHVLFSLGCNSLETVKSSSGSVPGLQIYGSLSLPHIWLSRRNPHVGHCSLWPQLCPYKISNQDLWYTQYPSLP